MDLAQDASKPRVGRPRTGHVYQHGDHWDIRIRLAGGRRGKPQHLPPHITEEQARKLAAQASMLARTENATREPPVSPGETADAWLERWTADRRARGICIAEYTVSRWKKWISPVLGRQVMRDVQRDAIESIVDRLDEAVHSGRIRPKTAINIWCIVKAAFRDARNAKSRTLRVRLDNPTDGVQGPDGGVRRSKPWLYPCEFVSLMSCPLVPVRWRRLFAVTTYLYLRAGEVAALTCDDVDLIGGVVLVHRAASHSGPRGAGSAPLTKPTKTLITHRVPIEPNLRPLLAVLLEEARAAGRTHLFTMPQDADLAPCLRRYLPRAGITRAELLADDETRAPLTFHDLRATGITWRAVRGDDALKIQRAVGHKSLGTTQRYIREAEVIGREIGEPFPPLPQAILATGLASLETGGARSMAIPAEPRTPPRGARALPYPARTESG